MRANYPLLLVAIMWMPAGVAAPHFDWEAATPGVEQFGRLVGHWRIEQETLQPDGSFSPGPPATWSFFYALGGHGIRDIWIQPDEDGSLPSGASRQYGTNLRVYLPDEDRWHIVWVSSDDLSFTEYTATCLPDGRMRMTGSDKSRPGVTQRITYYDIEADSWRWSLEFSGDGREWLTVSRLTATRIR